MEQPETIQLHSTNMFPAKSADSDILSKFYDQNENDLKELIVALEESQQRQLWDALSLKVINAAIQEAADLGVESPSNCDEKEKNASLKVWELTIRLARVTILQNCSIPKSLFDSVLLLHGYVLSMENQMLCEPIALLCEVWWLNSIEGKEALSIAPLVYLMRKCLLKRPAKSVIKRLWRLKEAVGFVEMESGQIIWDLILNLFAHQNFITNSFAQKFLAYVLATQQHLLRRIYGVLKHTLVTCTGVVAETYGQIVIDAWERSENTATKLSIEVDVIQDLMYNCIHIQRNTGKSLHSQLMKCMFKIHSRKSSAAVCSLLINLYKPILWRAICAANADVRANAAQLFFGCFPLVDTNQPQQVCEDSLQQQFNIIFDLLEDEDHIVRQVAVTGVCQVLFSFTHQIPDEVFSDLLNILFTKLAWDQSSPDVRVSVIEGISKLLDHHNNYSALTKLMPTLTDLLHDKSDKVRLAFVRLLLKIKHIRAFKIWKIISKEHLFARLEVDNMPICLKLVELTYKSFINDDLNTSVQVERCIELIESGLERARKFYRHAVVLINVQQAVNYMLLLRKCILACINKHKQNEKENKRPSLCTTLASLTMAAAQTKEKELEKTTLCDRQLGISSNFTMIDNQVTTYSLPEKGGSDEDEEQVLSVNNTLVMGGLIDVICIIWAGFRQELDKTANQKLKHILEDKFSRALLEFFPVFQNEQIHESLLYLASFLSSDQMTSISTDAEEKLCDLPSTTTTTTSCSNLVLCLSRWGKISKVLELLIDWSASLNSRVTRRSSRSGCKVERFLQCLVQVANELFKLPNFLQLVNEPTNHRVFESLKQRLVNVQKICVDCFKARDLADWDVDLLISLFTVHNKLAITYHLNEEEHLRDHIKDLCSLVNSHCIPILRPEVNGNSFVAPHLEAKKPRRLLDLQETILQQSVSSNSTLTGGDNDSTKQLAVKFSLAVFAAASSYLSVSPSVDFSSIKTVTSLFKYSDVLCAADTGIREALLEMISLVTKATLSLSVLIETEAERTLLQCWSSLLRATIAGLHSQPLTGKSKSSWISTLQCMELLPYQIQETLSDVISNCLLLLLNSNVDLTPTVVSNVELTVKCSKRLQQFIIHTWKTPSSDGDCNSADRAEHGNFQAVKMLLEFAEKI